MKPKIKKKENSENFDFRDFYAQRDDKFWREVDSIIQDYHLSNKNVLQQFMVFTQRRDIVQTLAYHELFSLIKDKPGSIVEAGVFMGNGLFTWAKLMETFCPGDRGRKVYGFDNFKGYEAGAKKTDSTGVDYIKSLIGDFKIDQEFVERMIRLHNMDNLIAGVERVKLYAGELSTTIPHFMESEEGVRISLLLVDLNLYAPTHYVLSKLYHRVIPGGIVALRGYGVRPWEGESRAVDEFLEQNKIKEVSKFSFSPYPAIYFLKQ
jgi:hypothetical protein